MMKTADHSRPRIACRQKQVADSIHRAVPLPPHILLHRSHAHPIIAEGLPGCDLLAQNGELLARTYAFRMCAKSETARERVRVIVTALTRLRALVTRASLFRTQPEGACRFRVALLAEIE